MRNFKSIVLVVALLSLMSSYAVASPTLEIRPFDAVFSETGDTLDFEIYLIGDGAADYSMMLYAYSLWLDSQELILNDFSYINPSTFTDHVLWDGSTWEARNDENTGWDTWYGSFNANDPIFNDYTLNVGEELHIGTISTTVLNPVLDGEWDIKVRYYAPMADAFYFAEDGYSGMTIAQTTGPDLAPVPIPGAIWLFGSGMLGLISIRRRTKK